MALPYNPVFARVEAISACLCAEILDPANGVPDVCFCGVVPGEAPSAMYAGNCKDKCGMAWTRLVSMYPANGVGVPLGTVARCDTGIGIEVEVGILRCMSVGDERGNPPSAQEQHDAAELQAADAMVMWKALLCCQAIPHGDVILSRYTPIGPEGGLVGGLIQVALAVP